MFTLGWYIEEQSRGSSSGIYIRGGNPDVGGKLDRLLCSHFPTLDTLLMRNCGLKPCDMSSVGEASVNGRLPKLSALDVSNNLLFY